MSDPAPAWAYKPRARTRLCDNCPWRLECEVLSALQILPMMCERVAESDVLLAELCDLGDLAVAGRKPMGEDRCCG
jgi:hypothetical protein